MKELQLQLSGALAAFSNEVRCQNRFTDDLPSRSHIIGLICCAMGQPRGVIPPMLETIDITTVNARDTPPERIIDYQTVQNVVTYEGKPRDPIVTKRHYLCDIDYRVTISGNDSVIETIRNALRRPKWPLYLGRKGCIPDKPLLLPTHSPV